MTSPNISPGKEQPWQENASGSQRERVSKQDPKKVFRVLSRLRR